MLVNGTIPNLFNGVSQQPASLRHRTQGEADENCYLTVAEGNKKRAPLEHVSTLAGVVTTDASFVHFIDKSPTEKYVVIINPTGGPYDPIQVSDALTGARMTLTAPNGFSYVDVADPSESLVAVTVADYTFIGNKTKVVAMASGTTSGAVTGTKQSFSQLPTSGMTVGDIYRIEGTPDTNFDDYYVRWDGSVWVETTKPGIPFAFDLNTMPFQLIKTGPTTFTFQVTNWTGRLVGDLISNPQPSFVGRTIQDILFYRNRLGFISGDGKTLTRSGEPFTFWAESATTVLDTDPIDRSVSSEKVSALNYGVPFNKALMLFSDRAQFQFGTGDASLTPTSGEAVLATEFDASRKARPEGAGQTMFFAVDKQATTAIREYYVDTDSVMNDAADITAHVPWYIPGNVFKLRASTTEDALLVLTKSERNAVYVYKYFWASRDEKVQSAWSRWTIDSGAKILGLEFFANTLYFIINRGAGVTSIEKMALDSNITDTGLTFRVHLDRRVALTGVYDPPNDWTTWTLPYDHDGDMQVVFGSAFTDDVGGTAPATRPSPSTVRVSGDWSAGPCWIGVPYTQLHRFSTIYHRDGEKVVMEDARLQLLRMTVLFDRTGYFRAEVTPRGRPKSTHVYTGKNVGVTTVGELPISSGTFQFPVRTRNKDATIDLINDSYLPSAFQSAEWVGNINPKAQRV